MLKHLKRLLTTISMGLALPLLSMAPVGAAGPVTVMPSDLHGWVINGDPSTSTDYEFSKDAASVGSGSIYVKPIGTTPADKFIAALPMGMAVADLTSVSYDFKIAGNGDAADANQFYLNVYTNLPGSSTFYDCRFDYVPTTGSTNDFTTATFNATDTPVNVASGGGVTCPATLAEMEAGSTVKFIAVNVGDTSDSDAGLAGYLDNVIITTASGTATYDFEPVVKVTAKDACKKGGWMTSNSPVYKNQGDCVSSFASQKSHNAPNPVVNFVRNLF